MSKKWLILYVIILMYLPVSIDATVLHVAAPRLSLELSATGSELLWIIDIYSLVMAGLLLPMGALGDRIGFKRLAMTGAVLFGLASLAAALAPSASALIAARAALAIGAAMILPATLAGVRRTFLDERERSMALGVWTAVGTGGAALGPLVGGFLLEHFYWGSVFLINLPIVLVVLLAIHYIVPEQESRPEQPWKIGQALVLIVALLLLVYAAKSGLRGGSSILPALGAALLGVGLLVAFIVQQLRSSTPMIDLRLLTQRVMVVGVVMALTAMITLVGFELLMAQELQFVLGKTPLEAGLFMLPLMISSGLSGPVAGWLASVFGLRPVATVGMALSALSFLGLAMTDFAGHPFMAWIWMVLLGFSVATALLASTAAIMASVPPEKAGAAGAMEGMAYELGAGLGVAIFGLMLTGSYAATIVLPAQLPAEAALQASASISEAMQLAGTLGGGLAESLQMAAQSAFTAAHSVVLGSASAMLAVLAVVVWFSIPRTSIPRVAH